jgi:hypothetical protein
MIVYRTKNFSDYPEEVIDLPNDKSWVISNPVSSIKLTKSEGKVVVIEENSDESVVRYLVLSCHRFSENYHTILLKNKSYTLKELLDIIYTYYNDKVMSYLDLKSLNSHDVWDYIDDACKTLKENPNQIIHPIDIMGDKKFFEGIYIEKDGAGDVQYILRLGS